MNDPVTAITGITYDRESIEKWLTTTNPTCPVTKQPLPPDSDLTPNHTLRRLIQAWCTLNAKHGVDRIPTPKSPFGRSHVLKLIRDLNDPALSESALKKMGTLAGESERNRKCIENSGAVDAVVKFLVSRRCRDNGRIEISGVSEALSVLRLIPVSQSRSRNYEELIGFLKRITADETVDDETMKTNALRVLKMVLQVSEKKVLEKFLDPGFLKAILNIIKQTRASKQLIKPALEVLQEACPYGMTREKMLDANAIFDLIELELDHSSSDHKQITELVFDLLARLCVFADGRRQFLSHAGALAMTAKRIMRVSAVTDERAVQILSVIARFAATQEVMKMARVGAVAKLCMVVQADCGGQVKEEAKKILRMHSNVWNKSPCIEVYLLTRYPN